jgi:hypothetical protein
MVVINEVIEYDYEWDVQMEVPSVKVDVVACGIQP